MRIHPPVSISKIMTIAWRRRGVAAGARDAPRRDPAGPVTTREGITIRTTAGKLPMCGSIINVPHPKQIIMWDAGPRCPRMGESLLVDGGAVTKRGVRVSVSVPASHATKLRRIVAVRQNDCVDAAMVEHIVIGAAGESVVARVHYAAKQKAGLQVHQQT